ncbi:serine/arginine repetitive matrix protein 1-like [Meriones unguiculatus]|uniref:serine/arginine repetitive matrix protein 1-like n=1 Tax=Meriones unguiculatus TaxID=10047 RepID=UPI00293E4453|nr:serine/arginine repetitive matrix protein 1-like [Meriones unguiculatus]
MGKHADQVCSPYRDGSERPRKANPDSRPQFCEEITFYICTFQGGIKCITLQGSGSPPAKRGSARPRRRQPVSPRGAPREHFPGGPSLGEPRPPARAPALPPSSRKGLDDRQRGTRRACGARGRAGPARGGRRRRGRAPRELSLRSFQNPQPNFQNLPIRRAEKRYQEFRDSANRMQASGDRNTKSQKRQRTKD